MVTGLCCNDLNLAQPIHLYAGDVIFYTSFPASSFVVNSYIAFILYFDYFESLNSNQSRCN